MAYNFSHCPKRNTADKDKKISSYVDFEKLVFNILDEDVSPDSVVRSYAYIQDVDYYEKQQYIRYNDGMTAYINRDSSGKGVTQKREE